MIKYMQQALRIAKYGYATTAPNPMVGCLIVRENHIVGQGWHKHKGGPHAEVYALQQAGSLAKGATAFINLEPCSHFGATGPCVQALIAAGIKEVYIAHLDPNPLVNGRGVAQLQAAGIKVQIGLCEQLARRLNKVYLHFITRQTPFVTLKWAMSLDGQIQTPPNQDKWLTGTQARTKVHVLRKRCGAILVGSKTARRDDPQLTARSKTGRWLKKQPLRIILTAKGDLPLSLQVFNAKLPGKTIVATTTKADATWITNLQDLGVEVWILPEERTQVSLTALLQKLGQLNISHLLVEGGAEVHASFIEQRLFNELQVYLAPILIGRSSIFSGTNSTPRMTLSLQKYARVGKDFWLLANGGERCLVV